MHQSFNQRSFLLLRPGRAEDARKIEKAGGIRGKNNFLLKWLRRAQDNNIFPPDITSEIEWLRGKIIQAGDTDLEPMLDFVYATASRAEALKTPTGSCAATGAETFPPCLNPGFGRRNPATFYFVTLSCTKVTAEVH